MAMEPRNPIDIVKDEIEQLFDDAVAGLFVGKPIPIGKLTDVGRAYLQRPDKVIYAREKELLEVNARFNAQLARQIAGTLPTGHIYQLGYPGLLLRAAGFPDSPIEMSSTRLAEKSVQENHPFDMADVYDLVIFINNPIAVFRYGAAAKNIIVDIERNGKQYLVGVHFNQSGQEIKVLSVRGIFPKDNHEWLNWIAQGKADYLHKEKIQTLIDQQRINPADVAYLDLDFVTKIVQSFENPKQP